MTAPPTLPVALVPGRLHEDMDSERFWVAPGVVDDLRSRGLDVTTVDRLAAPTSWSDDAANVATQLARRTSSSGSDRFCVVAGSNGCSTAVRLAIDHPGLVARIVLAWPATAGDEVIDGLARIIIADTAGPDVADALLGAGAPGTLRGVSDDELTRLHLPCVVVPCLPENQAHQQRTVTALAGLIPDLHLVAGTPEAPSDDFGPFREAFGRVVTAVATIGPDDDAR